MYPSRSVGFLFVVVIVFAVSPPTLADLIGYSFVERDIWDIDPATGAGSNPRDTGVDRMVGIALGPDGHLYGITTFGPLSGNPNSLYRINRRTGAATLIGPTGLQFISEGDLAFDPTTGVLYGASNFLAFQTSSLFTVDITTGAATVIGNLPLDRDAAQGMVFDNAGQLYTLDSTNGALLHIDKANAAILQTIPVNVAMGNRGAMARDPSVGTGVWYTVDGGSGGTNTLHSLDPVTGAMTPLGPLPSSGGFTGLTWVPPVPEPTTMTMAASLIAWICLKRRR